MDEPSPRTSRLALAAGLAGAIVIGGAGFLLGRGTAPVPAPRAAPIATPAPTPSAAPAIASTLDRAGLLALANGAADATASGLPIPEAVRSAAGRRFDLAIPFGCDGPTPVDRASGSGWSYAEDSETLRIRVPPARWSSSDWSPEAPSTDKLEGFWIARPWSSLQQCPENRGGGGVTDSEPVLLPGQTLAIARPVGEAVGTPRALETVQRVPRGEFNVTRGLLLRVIGRIDAARGAAPVRCVQPGGGDQRPLCLIRADFTEYRIENPVDGKVLAVWPANGPAPDAR